MVIHSFDESLRARRQIHSFEVSRSKRVALWRPVDWWCGVYFVASLLLVMFLDNFVSIVDLIGSAFSLVVDGNTSVSSGLICYLGIPMTVAWLTMNVELDGRMPHWWLLSCARYLRRPKRTWCGRSIRSEGRRTSYAGRVRFWWGIDSPRLHHGWVRGGVVHSRVPVRFTHALRHRSPVVEPGDGILLDGYEVPGLLEIRP